MEDLMEDMITNVELQHGETSFSENSSLGEFQPIDDLNKRFEYMEIRLRKMATHFKEYNIKLVEGERSTPELAKRTDDFLEELFETWKMVQTIDAMADLAHRIAMRNERLVANCAGEPQGLREGSQQNWSEQRICQDQKLCIGTRAENRSANEDSFSEGDTLNVTRAELASMGADNVTSRRGQLSLDNRRMTQALAEKQEGMEETLSQLDERVS